MFLEVEPPAAIRQRLGMERGAKALSVRRLRGTSKIFPVVLLHSYVPSHFGISRSEDFTGSLYQLIENKYRIPIAYADEEISANSARKEEAKHLQIATDSTVLVHGAANVYQHGSAAGICAGRLSTGTLHLHDPPSQINRGEREETNSMKSESLRSAAGVIVDTPTRKGSIHRRRLCAGRPVARRI